MIAFIYDKKRKEIAPIEVEITNLDLLVQAENEKTRKYELLANEIAQTYKCKMRIIIYVIRLDLTTTVNTEMK